MEDLLIRYGFIAVLVGTALEGDVTALLAGVITHLGYMKPLAAFAAVWLGALSSDAAVFMVARQAGARVRETRAYERVAPLIATMTRRSGVGELFLTHFIVGTRVASMIFWGLEGLSWTRFLVIDAASCAVWAVVMVALGYAFSGSAALIIGDVKRVEWWLAAALLLGAALVLAARRGLRRVTSTVREEEL